MGIKSSTSKAHVIRAILESVAFRSVYLDGGEGWVGGGVIGPLSLCLELSIIVIVPI